MLVASVTGVNSSFPPSAPLVASYAGISRLFRRPPLLPYPPLPGSADRQGVGAGWAVGDVRRE